MGEMRNAYKILVRIAEGNRLLAEPRSRWENNIKRHLKEMGLDVDWNQLAQDRFQWRALVNTELNLGFL
jgi:hypothetical protein